MRPHWTLLRLSANLTGFIAFYCVSISLGLGMSEKQGNSYNQLLAGATRTAVGFYR